MYRRAFLINSTLAGVGVGLSAFKLPTMNDGDVGNKKIGIIGLDTSHSTIFTQELNEKKDSSYLGYRIVAAYPYGSADIETSYSRIPKIRKQVEDAGVKIVDSIDALLKEVDFVLLETNDGKPRLEQAMQVIKAGKPLFIDKPIAANLIDILIIYQLADKYQVPIFSSSSLRYTPHVQEVVGGKIGKVLGADAFSPCSLEKTHPDLFWYGIHGVEMLFSVMGKGCRKVSRTHTEGTDIVVGVWEDGRVGTFRGTRTGKHKFGGIAHGENDDISLGPHGGHAPLLKEIINFFETGKSPVPQDETIEIYTFMTAADDSKMIGGGRIDMNEVLNRSYREAERKLNQI